MSDTYTGTVKSSSSFTQTVGSGFLSGQAFNASLNTTVTFAAAGHAADQIEGVAVLQLTFAASTAQNVDLTNLVDVLNNAVNFARVRSIKLRVNSTTDGAYLALSPGSTNGWTAMLATGSSFKVLASTTDNAGYFEVAAPNTTGYVTSSTNKVLTLTPSAHAFTVDLIISGCLS